MKTAYDQGRVEREFVVGDWIYLQLQPYRQTSLALRQSHKLSPQFYGPYHVLEQIGSVAYRLDLPPGSKIHPVFHVSILKKQLGTTDKIDSPIPLVSETSTHLQPQPIAVLNSRNNRRKRELLIQWQGLPTTNVTWEDEYQLRNKFLDFVCP